VSPVNQQLGELIKLIELTELRAQALRRRAMCGESVIISIDGPAGSGKTTLATELASTLPDSQIIHMDDLYLGWQNTLTISLTENLLGIVAEIAGQARVTYRKFNWLTSSLGEVVEYQAPRFLILEGVGSGQSAIRPSISMSVWIEVPVEIGLERVIRRDGEIVRDHMRAFLADQESHFQKEETKMHAEYHFNGLGIV
jgi:energy-coupling factor transporter ATP-binding protein EcfA2